MRDEEIARLRIADSSCSGPDSASSATSDSDPNDDASDNDSEAGIPTTLAALPGRLAKRVKRPRRSRIAHADDAKLDAAITDLREAVPNVSVLGSRDATTLPGGVVKGYHDRTHKMVTSAAAAVMAAAVALTLGPKAPHEALIGRRVFSVGHALAGELAVTRRVDALRARVGTSVPLKRLREVAWRFKPADSRATTLCGSEEFEKAATSLRPKSSKKPVTKPEYDSSYRPGGSRPHDPPMAFYMQWFTLWLHAIRFRNIGGLTVQRVNAELETRTTGEAALTASWAVVLSFLVAYWGLRLVDNASMLEVIVSMSNLAALAQSISQELATKFNDTYIMCPVVIHQQSPNGYITPLIVFRPVLVALKSLFNVGSGTRIYACELEPLAFLALQSIQMCARGLHGVSIGYYTINSPLVPTTDSSSSSTTTWCINMTTLSSPLVSRMSKPHARIGSFRGWEPALAQFNKALFAQSVSVFGRILGLIKAKGHRQCPILFPTANGDATIRMFPLSHVASASLTGRGLTVDHLKQSPQSVFLFFRRKLPIQYGNRVVNSPISAVVGADGKETGDWNVCMLDRA
ncbi:hypothetical protein BCR44DRAFT_58961 [Catenaria anguillulae PL171]|uniref:Uncharacterized protein n=1 Tax=Catenaria anguillulae PL171 TaxID=765915 RepID=A0A1Y2HZ71_9FUNG|nr:hypothetical protein BCR44DRAFT_58961 [Catenaria anguillulae PL171]